jgi:hypothetical protein
LSKSKVPENNPQITDSTRKRFAEEKDFHPEWLTFGLDFVLQRLRTKCYKHQNNRATAAYDIQLGVNSAAVGQKNPPKGWFTCGCSHESHILDLLAWKVWLIANRFSYFCNLKEKWLQHPDQSPMPPGVAIAKTAFGHGTVDQRRAYLQLLQDVTHVALDDLLQPALHRTFAVALASVSSLAEGMAEGKFTLSSGDSADLENALLDIVHRLEDVADRALPAESPK